MPRKKDKAKGEEAVEELYRLKTGAVDDLVTADVSNTPKYSEEELRKYRTKGLELPEWLKLMFIKFWFPAAVCFFFIWGLGAYVGAFLDLMVITAIALGIVTDLLTNSALRFFASKKGANDRYMMFPGKSYMNFIWNILYAGVLLFMVYTLYNVINVFLIKVLSLPADTVPLGVEPILFGVFYVLCDSLLIACKHMLVSIIGDAKRSAGKK